MTGDIYKRSCLWERKRKREMKKERELVCEREGCVCVRERVREREREGENKKGKRERGYTSTSISSLDNLNTSSLLLEILYFYLLISLCVLVYKQNNDHLLKILFRFFFLLNPFFFLFQKCIRHDHNTQEAKSSFAFWNFWKLKCSFF